jgi:8-oxo-dGTP pyrophosphatase MutT (NUDIX family)
MPFTVDQIRRALSRHRPQVIPREEVTVEAAVALVLAGLDGELSLCAIRRSERPDDPWSGHMALPGGRSSPEDGGPRGAAERETFEEVGLELAEAQLLGPLSEMLVRLGGSSRAMALAPFVYYLGEELAPFVVHDEEVAEAFWIPLAYLWDAQNASRMEWERQGTKLMYPAIRFGEQAIWGITFRVLTLFSDVLDAPLPHLEEIPGLGR